MCFDPLAARIVFNSAARRRIGCGPAGTGRPSCGGSRLSTRAVLHAPPAHPDVTCRVLPSRSPPAPCPKKNRPARQLRGRGEKSVAPGEQAQCASGCAPGRSSRNHVVFRIAPAAAGPPAESASVRLAEFRIPDLGARRSRAQRLRRGAENRRNRKVRHHRSRYLLHGWGGTNPPETKKEPHPDDPGPPHCCVGGGACLAHGAALQAIIGTRLPSGEECSAATGICQGRDFAPRSSIWGSGGASWSQVRGGDNRFS